MYIFYLNFKLQSHYNLERCIESGIQERDNWNRTRTMGRIERAETDLNLCLHMIKGYVYSIKMD